MEFEGHHFNDAHELRQALRDSWPGVWVEPRGGSDPMPFTWALRCGELDPAWQPEVSAACAALLLDPDDNVAFAALDALRAAPWDVGPVVAGWAADHVDDLAARRSPRQHARTALAEVTTLLLASPRKDAMPATLAKALAGRTDAAEGFPETALLAVAMGAPVARSAAAERLVDALAAAADPAPLADQVLALGVQASKPVMEAVRSRDGALAARVGDAMKARLEAAAAAVEAGLKNPDYPDVVKARLKAARGSHTKRWKDVAAQLGVVAGKFGG